MTTTKLPSVVHARSSGPLHKRQAPPSLCVQLVLPGSSVPILILTHQVVKWRPKGFPLQLKSPLFHTAPFPSEGAEVASPICTKVIGLGMLRTCIGCLTSDQKHIPYNYKSYTVRGTTPGAKHSTVMVHVQQREMHTRVLWRSGMAQNTSGGSCATSSARAAVFSRRSGPRPTGDLCRPVEARWW